MSTARALALVGLFAIAHAGCTGGDACDGVTCSGNGTCVVRGGAAACRCAPGYDAVGLECVADPCSGAPCVHGTCSATGAAPACACEPGYAGAACDACADGFHAEQLFCVPDAPCTVKCVHGACAADLGSCACEVGFAGDSCDECAVGYHPVGLRCVGDSACDPDPCVHGTCQVLGGEPACACAEGYAGARCNECADGYEPDGLVCVPGTVPPLCSPNPCTEPHRTVCAAAGDGYRCDCDSGYHLEGTTCVADPVCQATSCPEPHRTVCEPAGAAFVCRCDPGYHDEGGACVLTTPCRPNPCTAAHRTVCQVAGGTFACACDPGHHDESGTCVADVVCDAATTCSGHGTCTGVGLECACSTGYAGDHCDACASGHHPDGQACVLDTPCAPNPCTAAHRTRCVPSGSTHECRCDTGYQDNDGDGTCAPTCATAGLSCGTDQVCSDAAGTATCVAGQKPPIYISFHWHMHQPIYWPYESIVATQAANRMGYSVYQIHLDRTGPYTSWPHDAIQAGLGQASLGAQVSFSGSLMENLQGMKSAGAGFAGWTAPWTEALGWTTTRGNPRLDLVNFGYHHPLMGLIDVADMRLQIQAHREQATRVFGSHPPSKGIFPPECAFTPRMIPALVAEGIEWSLVDNIHFDRAHVSYNYTPASNLPPPNAADQVNDAPTNWVALQNIWAPSLVSAPWGYQPHWVLHRDPVTGQESRMIAVPAARYEGNEDARGGFGALQYEAVMSQYEQLNTDPAHPMLIVLHHDGDNYGGGTESYYHSNFQNFVGWVAGQPTRFVATTIQDYLDQFPPDANDVIHVEDGSWSGADNGDPEFQKWNGDPAADGYSPDRNSWAVVTAMKNRVLTADAILPRTGVAAVIDGSGTATDAAWHYLLNAETSCYWYWDNSAGGLWDSHPTRAANQAAAHADPVVASGADTVGPTIYLPQREPYNPGVGTAGRDVTIWTLVYDVSGLQSVTLAYRVDADGVRTGANDLVAGGAWTQVGMTSVPLPAARTDPQPLYRATEYAATITGLTNTLVDYYVIATDTLGSVTRSPLQHVWIGSGSGASSGLYSPQQPTANDAITITWNKPAKLHWGVDASLLGHWSKPPAEYWPAGSVLWTDGKAIESSLVGPNASGKYTIVIGPFNQTAVHEVNFVFHNNDGSWSSPDQTIPIN
jgi:hypothetical protein